MTKYHSPSFPDKKEKRHKPDRRNDSLSLALKELLPSVKEYLKMSAEAQQLKTDIELKRAKADLKSAEVLNQLVEHLTLINSQKKIRLGGRKKSKKLFDKHHQKVLRIIKEMKSEDKRYAEIAAYLNENGIPTFSGRGSWHPQTVHRLYEDNLDDNE